MDKTLEEQQAAMYYALSVEEQHKMLPVVDEMVENLVREPVEPSREPVAFSKYKEPVMYYEPSEGTGGLPAVICTCGWSKHHLRMKILQIASEKHFRKTGHRPASKE